ncbi:MAG TPA: molybdenum cofactor biosynthesis protein MoaE [Phytomonospora sp.]
MIHAVVTSEPIEVASHEAMVADATAGAVVSFAGVVRDHDGGKSVSALVYEAHPSAGKVVEEVAADIAARPGITHVAVSHRVGALSIGDAALVAAVSGPHRAEVFAACAALVDEVKARLPVWKHQHFADGTDEWVNSA